MTTHILRHGQTDYSLAHLVNGDPAQPVLLNQQGWQSCRQARSTLPLRNVKTWITSEFPRARQTTLMLTDWPAVEALVDPHLNELDYGSFEGGPFLSYAAWLDRHGAGERPDGARESQQEGIARMLKGVLLALDSPGDRVIVGHGLLVSVVNWARCNDQGHDLPLFLPEAPYVEPLSLPDDEVIALITSLFNALGRTVAMSQVDRRRPTATFDAVSQTLQ